MADDDAMKEPAYIEALKKYGAEEPTTDDVQAIEVELFDGPDRGAALVLGALVERSLEHLLRKNLSNDGINKLFKYGGPLGDFASKIEMAFAMGLFTVVTRRELNILRHLRNQFAHSRKPITFTTPEVLEVCKHLTYPDQSDVHLNFNMLNKVSDERLAQASDKGHPRTRYFTSCNEIAQRIYFLRGGLPSTSDLNKLL